MPKIYPQETFDKQTNGTVFYREGQLTDFPIAKKGIFESWRYNFDSGKQIFRAESDDGKGAIYEKRLVKDINGIAKWTGWMEIPNGEANGVQAIAINDRPLQLPNTDGAIKLQITPEIIDTFTKQEIYDLVTQKIRDNNDRVYTYVSWCIDPDTNRWAANAERVLQLTFPDGGVVERFYLVEPHPGTSGVQEDAMYYVWDIKQTPTPHDDWIKINDPGLRAFVSYPVFNEHATDTRQHLADDDREKVDSITNISGSLDTHINDVGMPMSPHITVEERDRWNSQGQVKEIPNDGVRYVGYNGEYVPAYEQPGIEGAASNTKIFDNAWTGKDSKVLKEGILNEFNTIIANHNQIERVKLEFTNINTNQTQVWFETDTGVKSPKYFTQMGLQVWDLESLTPFDKITLYADDPNKTISFNNIKVYIINKQLVSVNVGDPSLSFNMIGPEDKEPMYNGKPLSEVVASPDVYWENIVGDPSTNVELNLKLADVIRNKVDVADNTSNLRYDIFRGSVIASLIQQPNSELLIEEIIPADIPNVLTGTTIISGIQAKIDSLKARGSMPISAKLEIGFVASADHAIYFDTDNSLIQPSPTVTSSKFTWEWPGTLFNFFDEIRLKGGPENYKVNYLEKIKFTLTGLKFGDVVAESPGHSWTQNAVDYNLNASGNVANNVNGNYKLAVSGEVDINAAKINLGNTQAYSAYDNREKEIAETLNYNSLNPTTPKPVPESLHTMNIYGEEADNRYGSRPILEDGIYRIGALENTTTEIISKQIKEEEERKLEDDTINERINDFASGLQEQLPGYLQEKYDEFSSGLVDRVTTIEDTYYTMEEADEAVADYTYDKATIDNMLVNISDHFDLIIESDAELKERIENGDFERAESILFRRKEDGVRQYRYNSGTTTAKIDLTNVRFIKGEEPTDVILEDVACFNLDKTIVETITIKFKEYGTANFAYLNSKASQIKTVDLTQAEQTVILDKYFDIYRLNLNTDCFVTLQNVDHGREYIIFIDHPEVISKIGFTNKVFNYSREEELVILDYIKNCSNNSRTVLRITGTNEAGVDGFVINELIPSVENRPEYSRSIYLGNIRGKLYNSSEKDTAVYVGGYTEGMEIAKLKNGQQVKIKAEFTNGDGVKGNCTGWKDNDNGPTWKLIERSTKAVVASGIMAQLDGVQSIYDIPVNESKEDLILEFIISPQMVAIILDRNIATEMTPKIKSRKGFTDANSTLYQAYYNNAKVEVVMLDNNPTGWFIHTMETNTGYKTTAGYIWEFQIKDLIDSDTYDHNGKTYPSVTIKPYIYKRVYGATAVVIDGSVNQSTDLLFGPQGNRILFQNIVTNPTDNTPLDPIRITAYDPGIEYQIIESNGYNGFLVVSDEALLGDTSRIDIVTASGTTIHWNPRIVRPSNIVIGGDIATDVYSTNANPLLGQTVYKVHKGPMAGSTEDIEMHINWLNQPAINKGRWFLEGNAGLAEIISNEPDPTKPNSDKAILRFKEKGFVTVGFTSLDGVTIRQLVEIHVHVEAAEIVPLSANQTTTNSSFVIKWLDRVGAGAVECSGKLTNITGIWDIISGQEYVAIENGTLRSVAPIPADQESIEATIQFISNDVRYKVNNPIVVTYNVIVFRGIYELMLLKDNNDQHYEGGSVSFPYNQQAPNGYLRLIADGDYVIRLQFNNGWTASNETVAEFANKLGATIDGHQVSGITAFKFKMPYKNDIINVSAKAI